MKTEDIVNLMKYLNQPLNEEELRENIKHPQCEMVYTESRAPRVNTGGHNGLQKEKKEERKIR